MEEFAAPQYYQGPENMCRASPWHTEAVQVIKQSKPIPEHVLKNAADVQQSGMN